MNVIESNPGNSYQMQAEVSVKFNKMIDKTEELEEAVSTIKDPQVVIWFQGRKGLPEDWFLFCNNSLIGTIRKVCDQRNFILYDLRNWSLLRKKNGTPDPDSEVVFRIKELNCPDIKCLDSADYFIFLKSCTSRKTVEYVNKTLWNREFIWLKSQRFRPSKITLYQSLGKCQLLEGIKDRDSSKAYSGLQYLEGAFLVLEIVKQKLEVPEYTKGNVDIVFLLPNDEYAYYQDEKNSFQTDLNELLSRSEFIPKDSELKVNVTFTPFKWGEKMNQRPYLSDSDPIQEGRLDILKV